MPTTSGGKKKEEKESRTKKSSKRDSPVDRTSSRRDTKGKDKTKKRSSSSSSKRKRSKSPKKSTRTKVDGDDSPNAHGQPVPKPPAAAAAAPSPPVENTSLPQPPSAQDPQASSDFEAGLLFQKFARNGGVGAEDFQRMWRDRDVSGGRVQSGNQAGILRRASHIMAEEIGRRPAPRYDGVEPERMFEFGQLFQRFDTDGDGRLGQADFERLIKGIMERPRDIVERGESVEQDRGRGTRAAPPGDKTTGDAGDMAMGTVLPPSITHYDETTGVPLTREAVASQLSLGHTVVLLNEAHSRRLSRLQTLASSRLMPVRQQLLQLRRRIHNRADEVKAAKAAIERETMADASAIVERLRSIEALKQASLAQAGNDVTADLEGVEKLAHQVNGVTAVSTVGQLASSQQGYNPTYNLEGTQKMVELIQCYPELCISIERVANKPFDLDIGIRADDLPHETAERLEVLRRADQYEKALGIKDHMLWQTLQESRSLEEQCQEQTRLGQEFAEEAQEWVLLAGTLADEVKVLREAASMMPELKKTNESLVRANKDLKKRLEELGGKIWNGEDIPNS